MIEKIVTYLATLCNISQAQNIRQTVEVNADWLRLFQ